METRFFYNPFTGKFFNCEYSSHVNYYHNKKLKHSFDEYIRGIIKDNKLFLRVYYPFDDIDILSHDEIMKKSFSLLTEFTNDIIKALKKENIKPNKIFLNVSNVDLKNYLNKMYV